MPIDNEPHLTKVRHHSQLMSPTSYLDYNDRQATMAFLKKCSFSNAQPTSIEAALGARSSQSATEHCSTDQPVPSTSTGSTHKDTGRVYLLGCAQFTRSRQVHKDCCKWRYTKGDDIQRTLKRARKPSPRMKTSLCVSIGPYNCRTDCLFCGRTVVPDSHWTPY